MFVIKEGLKMVNNKSVNELPIEIHNLLKDIRFGDRKSKLDAMEKLEDKAIAHLNEVRQTILDSMAKGDGVVQLYGAKTLAVLGDESEMVIKILVMNLSPATDDKNTEMVLKSVALEGLSHVRGSPEITNAILQLADDEIPLVQKSVYYAIGAIGDTTGRDFLEYQSQRGNKTAKIALDMFGKADFHIIWAVDVHGYDARKCGACGYRGSMKTTLTGKKKCPKCGTTGQDSLLWPSTSKK